MRPVSVSIKGSKGAKLFLKFLPSPLGKGRGIIG
jgi:hypothetical protein